ncbi:universal stress protein UspB, partial [Yersinia enterocolitica]|nr:universal stress protein UspB [Yersinia enterocolitica]
IRDFCLGGAVRRCDQETGKQIRLVGYIFAQRYLDHHDPEFIRRCERLRGQFILTSALCGLVMVSLLGLILWY